MPLLGPMLKHKEDSWPRNENPNGRIKGLSLDADVMTGCISTLVRLSCRWRNTNDRGNAK